MNSTLHFALLFAGALLASVGAGAYYAGEQGAAFGLFALLTVGGGLICLFERSVVRSAFALLSTFLGTAGLFLLLGSDFLAMAQVLIYVGGILALLLFGVLLTPPDLNERRLPRVFAALIASGTLGGLVLWRCADVQAFTRSAPDVVPTSDAEVIGVAFLDPAQYLLPFELAAVFLTVALVAAVFIARRRDLVTPEVSSDSEPKAGA